MVPCILSDTSFTFDPSYDAVFVVAAVLTVTLLGILRPAHTQMRILAALLLLATPVIAAAPTRRTPSPTAPVAELIYTFVCFQAQAELCLGIPTGDVVATSALGLVAKDYIKNEDKGLDGFKLRFNTNFHNGTITYSLNPQLCLQPVPGSSAARYPAVEIAPCVDGLNEWNLTSFATSPGARGKLVHVDTGLCATQMRCHPKVSPAGTKYCEPYPARTVPGNTVTVAFDTAMATAKSIGG